MGARAAAEGPGPVRRIGASAATGLVLLLVGCGSGTVGPSEDVAPSSASTSTSIGEEPAPTAPFAIPGPGGQVPDDGTANDSLDDVRAWRACQFDTELITEAALAWHDRYLEGDRVAATPWPTSFEDLVDAGLLAEPSTLHTLSGDGVDPPTIAKRTVECADEITLQIDPPRPGGGAPPSEEGPTEVPPDAVT